MKDIGSREDIELLVRQFYLKVRVNKILGYIFNEVMHVDWEHHTPIVVDFWESILLDAGTYKRNAMGEHFNVNQKVKLEPIHFDTWLALFFEAVDENFEGEKAALAKNRAAGISQLIQLKMEQINQA